MTAPTWIPYNALAHGGFCEICRAPATWALVRLSTGIALDLVRIVCDQHRPADVADHGGDGDRDAGAGADELDHGEPRAVRPSSRRRAP